MNKDLKIHAFFEKELEVDIKSLSFNFVKYNDLGDLPPIKDGNKIYLSLYSLGVSEDDLDVAQERMNKKQKLISKNLENLGFLNTLILLKATNK